MPDLPGAMDEPYDRRFVKWMIKNKVGWASARAPGYGFIGCVLLGGPNQRADGPESSPAAAMSPGTELHPFQGMGNLFNLHKGAMWAGRNEFLASQGLGIDICTVRSWSINPELMQLRPVI